MRDGFEVGQEVAKVVGDYRFEGIVVAVFVKRSGAWRYVVEDDRGLLFIFSGKDLVPRRRAEEGR